MLVYLNGRYIPKEEALIPVDDRGFVFGDGVYELTRALGGKLLSEDGHWARLARGMRELQVAGPEHMNQPLLRQISERLLSENGLMDGDATVYAQVTRGSAPRAHIFPQGTAPTVYVATSPFTSPLELRQSGVRAITLPDVRWARCDLKTVNLLANVMAKQRAHEAGAFEAVLIRDGAITEGSSTNVFGVMRDVVLGLARELGCPVDETPIFASEIGRLQELFLTGTTSEVQPIVELDGKPVGDGRPGPIAMRLLDALYQRLGLGAPVAD
jgi:D-alanine transaminase